MDALRRGAFFALAVVLGFLLLELPWNDGVFAIPQRYVIDNLLILGLGCAITFLAGQRTRASLAVFTGFCLLWGTANFFIITFKGQPIVPADLFALGTAASVAGGYSLFLTGRLAFCWALFAAYCIALAKLCPQRKRARWDVAANVLAAALLELLPQPEEFVKRLNGLGIPGVTYHREQAEKCGITGTHITVTVDGHAEGEHDHEHDHHHEHDHGHHHHHSGMEEISHLIGHLPVSEKVRADIRAVYDAIAQAESHVHGVPVTDIHFHEVGTMDAVADVTAVCLLMEELAADQVIASKSFRSYRVKKPLLLAFQ